MKVFLAGDGLWRETGLYDKLITTHRPFILESFYYVNEYTEKLLPLYGDFLLDSGAFTFMQNNSSHLDWDEYIERYCDFINRNKVEKFFELDIDSVVGYDKVKEYRRKIERLTGRPVIPVWHTSRGKEDFLRSCDEYPYVALGGIAGGTKGSKQSKLYEQSFPWFIREAHKRGTKIHGLGYTSLKGLKVNHFDSVDSTAWTTGNRFGYIYHFDGHTMKKFEVPAGKRIGKIREAALINYCEWLKFQKYAERNL